MLKVGAVSGDGEGYYVGKSDKSAKVIKTIQKSHQVIALYLNYTVSLSIFDSIV